ncbi:hypothetical protein K7432_013181 [Basidiobolus ranarum]|uniref:Uncharacterized protein n=1 Tax=Basidiobolus ranarum TaxID=34480 RepID=A0ABR2VR82_9FUNG
MVVNSLVKFGFSYSNEIPTFLMLITVTSVLVCIGLVIKLSKVNSNVLRRVTWSFSPTTSKPILPSTLSTLRETGLPTLCTNQMPLENSLSNISEKRLDYKVSDAKVAIDKTLGLSEVKKIGETANISPRKTSLTQAVPSNEIKSKKDKPQHVELSKLTDSSATNSQELNSISTEESHPEGTSAKSKSSLDTEMDHNSHRIVDTSIVSPADDKDFIAIEKRRRRKNKKVKNLANGSPQTITQSDNKVEIPKHSKQIRRRQKTSSAESSPHQSPTSSPKVAKLISFKQSPDNTASCQSRAPPAIPANNVNASMVTNTRRPHSVNPPPRATFINMGYDFQQWYSPFASGFHVDVSDRRLDQRESLPISSNRPNPNFSVAKQASQLPQRNNFRSDSYSRYIPQGQQFSLFERGF